MECSLVDVQASGGGRVDRSSDVVGNFSNFSPVGAAGPASLELIVQLTCDELFKLFKVNIGQHGLEREIASGYAYGEKRTVQERAKDHYEQYTQALETLAKAADAACAKVEEAKREKSTV